MMTQHLQGLLDCVKGGDAAQIARVSRLLRPVVSQAVERVLQKIVDQKPISSEDRAMFKQARKAGSARGAS